MSHLLITFLESKHLTNLNLKILISLLFSFALSIGIYDINKYLNAQIIKIAFAITSNVDILTYHAISPFVMNETNPKIIENIRNLFATISMVL